MAKICMPLLHLGFFFMQGTVVVDRCHSCIGLLVATLFWKIKRLIVLWKLVLREEAFGSFPTFEPCVQQVKGGLLMPGIGVFLRSSLLLVGNIVNTDEKCDLNCVSIFIQNIICMVDFHQIVNNMISYDLFRYSYYSMLAILIKSF